MRATWNGRVIRNAWHTNVWSGGSYVYYPPGYMTTLLGIEAEREGNYFFAGEHTSHKWQGYMNGAIESGRRAAAGPSELFVIGVGACTAADVIFAPTVGTTYFVQVGSNNTTASALARSS
ncbi:MAG: FAD-dependent oxidoreductase [Rhodobacteraceae bacterium]|nr:FAD-dependent oxidoreductase [Paracoccaceae bacterium]